MTFVGRGNQRVQYQLRGSGESVATATAGVQ